MYSVNWRTIQFVKSCLRSGAWKFHFSEKRLLIKVERAKEKKNVGKLLKNWDFSMPYHICTAKMKGLTKGGWISERLSLCLKSPKKDAKSLSWALSTKKEDAKESELASL